MTKIRITEKMVKLAENLKRLEEPGMTLKRAISEAGYAESTSLQGWNAVPNAVVKLLAKKGIRLRELGRIDATTQEEIVRGRLVYNTLKGKDSGVMSAKALGSERRVNMFTPDSVTGVVVLAAPQAAMDRKAELLGEIAESAAKPSTLPE